MPHISEFVSQFKIGRKGMTNRALNPKISIQFHKILILGQALNSSWQSKNKSNEVIKKWKRKP